VFIGDHTNLRREFDCTSVIFSLTMPQLHQLQDADHTTDNLVPQEIIEEAIAKFNEDFGVFRNEFRHIEFGYSVKVVQSILDYFEVTSLSEIHF
jgi:hypothetical protein